MNRPVDLVANIIRRHRSKLLSTGSLAELCMEELARNGWRVVKLSPRYDTLALAEAEDASSYRIEEEW